MITDGEPTGHIRGRVSLLRLTPAFAAHEPRNDVCAKVAALHQERTIRINKQHTFILEGRNFYLRGPYFLLFFLFGVDPSMDGR